MKGSIKLFKIFGISIEVHITFLLLPMVFGFTAGIKGVVLILLVFILVTLHELSHSLAAKRFGINVERITLLPIGGVASMSSIPKKPLEEFIVAVAGPLFNIAVAVIFYYPAYILLGPDVLFHPGLQSWPNTLAYAFWVNPVLALFNLLPAFPMDGGRVLRAFLALKMSYKKATEIAVAFGHIFAIIFGFIGIMSKPPNLLYVAIAVFIYMAASQEQMQSEISDALRLFHVKDILTKDYIGVSSDTPILKVLEEIFHSHQEDFPVLENHKLIGILTRTDIMHSIHQFGMQQLVKDAMRRDFPSAKLTDPLSEVHKVMQDSGIRAIPILDRGALAGIITLEDISKVYIMMMSARR